MATDNHYNIIDREPVAEMIGYVPSTLSRWGIYLIALFVCAMLGICYVVRIPNVLTGRARIDFRQADSPECVLLLPAQGIGEIRPGHVVRIFLDAYPESKYGYLQGTVDKVLPVPDSNGYYSISVDLPKALTTNKNLTLDSRLSLTGIGEVVLHDERIIVSIFTPIRSLINIKN